MGNWNFDEIENSLVSDAEKRITRGYTQQPKEDVRGLDPGSPQTSENVAAGDLSPDILRQAEKSEKPTAPARGQSLGSVPMPTDSPQAAERPIDDIIGVKCSETKGVQTYLPLADYMRLLQQKTLRKQNIAQVAGVAIIDWLDRQEQSAPTSGKK